MNCLAVNELDDQPWKNESWQWCDGNICTWSDNLGSELQTQQVCLDFQRPAERQLEQQFREESREPMGYYGSNLWQHSPYEDQGHHNQNIHEVQAAKLRCLQNDKQLVNKATIHVTAK